MVFKVEKLSSCKTVRSIKSNFLVKRKEKNASKKETNADAEINITDDEARCLPETADAETTPLAEVEESSAPAGEAMPAAIEGVINDQEPDAVEPVAEAGEENAGTILDKADDLDAQAEETAAVNTAAADVEETTAVVEETTEVSKEIKVVDKKKNRSPLYNFFTRSARSAPATVEKSVDELAAPVEEAEKSVDELAAPLEEAAVSENSAAATVEETTEVVEESTDVVTETAEFSDEQLTAEMENAELPKPTMLNRFLCFAT